MTTTYTDNFNRGTLGGTLAGFTAFTNGTGETIVANEFVFGGVVFDQFYIADFGFANGSIQVKFISNNTTDHGLLIREQDSTHFVKVFASGGNVYIEVKDSGSTPTLIGAIGTLNGKTLRCDFNGALYTIYVNGSLLGTYTDPGAKYLTRTSHGLYAYSDNQTFDDFSITAPPLGFAAVVDLSAHIGLAVYVAPAPDQPDSGTGSLNVGDSLCLFEYTPRWQDFMELLFPEFKDDPHGDVATRVKQAVAILEQRDHDLEDHLRNRPCCDCDEGGGGG